MHPHDKKWVDDQLRLLPFNLRARAIENYKRVFNEELKNNTGISRENMARREANTRLRIYVEKVLKKI